MYVKYSVKPIQGVVMHTANSSSQEKEAGVLWWLLPSMIYVASSRSLWGYVSKGGGEQETKPLTIKAF